MKYHTRTVKLALIVALLLCLKLLLLLYLYNLGFISVSDDEFNRGITAAQWADGDLPTSLLMTHWLPGEILLNGFSLTIWDNVIWTPRITAFLFSCLLLIYFIKLVQNLFDLVPVTLLAGLFLVFNPWYTWLSGSPMLDIYYLALFVAGLYYFLNWSDTRRDIYLIITGIFFALSTTFHFPSWILVNVVNLCACYYAWEMLRDRDYKNLLKLIVFFFGVNLFIIVFLIGEFFSTGELFYLIRDHTYAGKNYLQGYNITIYKKLIYYPVLVAKNINLIGLFLPIGLYWLGTKSRKTFRLSLFVVGLVSLFFYSVFNLLSAPASSSPGRYSLPFFILLLPYSALGIYALFMNSGYFTNIRFRRAFVVILITFILGLSFIQSRRFVHRDERSALNTGLYLKKLMESEPSEKTETVIVEFTTDYDYLSVKLAVRDFDRVLLDRKQYYETSDFIVMGDDEILQHLRKEKTKFVAAKDETIKTRLSSLHFMHKMNKLGEWEVYCVDLTNGKLAPPCSLYYPP